MNDKEIAKDILIHALETGAVNYEKATTPEAAKANIEMICQAYRDIFQVVNNPRS